MRARRHGDRELAGGGEGGMGVRVGRAGWRGGGTAGCSGWLGVGMEGKGGKGLDGGATLLRIATFARSPPPW